MAAHVVVDACLARTWKTHCHAKHVRFAISFYMSAELLN